MRFTTQPRPAAWMLRGAIPARTDRRSQGRARVWGQRLMGLLAFGGLSLGIFVAARYAGPERHGDPTRNAGLSTLAPIMDTGRPRQAVRSAKLKPTP